MDLPALQDFKRRSGQHIHGRYNGKWTEVNEVEGTAVYIPQRYKHLTISVSDQSVLPDLSAGLEGLDALYDTARQLYKLNCFLQTFSHSGFAAIVNISSAAPQGAPVSGSFYLLSKGIPLYYALVFDVQENSVQLVWSTIDFKTDIQTRSLFRYVFFPFNPVVDRPIFMPTQALCARWWQLIKGFGESRHGLLRAANALELVLYKDPTVETYRR